MSHTLDQCQVQKIEFKTKNDILHSNIYLSTTTTNTSCHKCQTKKLLNGEKGSNSNSSIIVILFVIMNIINYMDRFTLAGKYLLNIFLNSYSKYIN
jgi:hypothetical protein